MFLNIIIVIILVLGLIILYFHFKPRKWEEDGGYVFGPKTRRTLKRHYKGKTATDKFITGDILRYNVAANNPTQREQINHEVGQKFNEAVLQIATEPDTAIRQELAPDFILNGVEDFYNARNEPIQTTINYAREALRGARKRKALKPARNRQERARNYYRDVNMVDYPQSVHEPEVNREINSLYQNIKRHNGKNIKKNITEDVHQELLAHDMNPQRREDALRILTRISRGDTITQMDNDREDYILAQVWARINAPENTARRESLKDALFNGMADSVENGNIVCAKGRCSRLVSSLVLFDRDPELSRPIHTTETLKEEIFSKSYRILQDKLDSATAALRKAYNAGEDSAEVKTFEENAKKTIEAEIRREYSERIDAATLDNIIQDAQAGV